MSTVIAMQAKGYAIIASDNQINYDNRRVTVPAPAAKLQKVGDYLIGFAGDLRAGQIVHYLFTPPTPVGIKTLTDLDQFITAAFIPGLKQTWDKHSYTQPADDSNDSGTVLLVSVLGIIYEIGSDYSWTRDQRRTYGIGTGGDYALGYMAGHNRMPTKATAETIIHQALCIASEYDINTSDKTIMYSQPTKRGLI